MRSFRVSFYADDATSPLAEFVIEAILDGEAIEEATRLFHEQFPEDAARPFRAHCRNA